MPEVIAPRLMLSSLSNPICSTAEMLVSVDLDRRHRSCEHR